MSQEVLYLGLDVHAENMAVAIAEAGREGEVRNYGVISSDLPVSISYCTSWGILAKNCVSAMRQVPAASCWHAI
ncbi:hypothetical protein SAMN02745166_05042 [Prosthecobacter debontii]|uniref:Transposase n=1 Tax=Prosthecobacter debontii TaxID=48467 RepID=A0A1T4Z486_9BACT|nr:hypothetical protein [Prosthecobacter debontii]SKB08850.1 hypothetical protein SAMN02745166_05042 [Prosthecobacter debontii]